MFYTGGNVHKMPHIAPLCLDIMDAIGTDYQLMPGPTHCCDTAQLRLEVVGESIGGSHQEDITKLSRSSRTSTRSSPTQPT